MQIVQNGQLRRHVMDALAKEYLSEKPFPHLTELIYCLTRSYFDRTNRMAPTDDELLRFSVGFGLERVMISTMPIEPMVVDGINITPDFLPDYGANVPGELKTTRMKAPEQLTADAFPQTWLEQIKGYCFACDTLEYDLAVLHLFQPELMAYRLIFTQEEVEDFWEYIAQRRDFYLQAVALREQPTAFQYCKDWECRGCRYKLWCDVQASEARRGNLKVVQ